MDLTECVEFTVEMAHAALDTHLRQEVKFLALLDDVAKYINGRHDLRSSDLATLIVTTYRNGGKLSSKRRKRFADRVQTVLDDVEATVANRMRGLSLLGGGQRRRIGTRMDCPTGLRHHERSVATHISETCCVTYVVGTVPVLTRGGCPAVDFEHRLLL